MLHVPPGARDASVVSVETSIGRAAVRGAVVGYFAVLLLVSTIVFTMAGVGIGTALAVGAFAGVWGGPGWGGMIAAQACADRLEDDERRSSQRQSRGRGETSSARPVVVKPLMGP